MWPILWSLLLSNYTYFCHIHFLADVIYTLSVFFYKTKTYFCHICFLADVTYTWKSPIKLHFFCHIRFLADVTYTLESLIIKLHLFLSQPFLSRCDLYFGASSCHLLFSRYLQAQLRWSSFIFGVSAPPTTLKISG